ncbi:MAG: CobQ/CobB/MinD/ParA nucleotide binding domain protein [Firmicutes bacterium ADurb.Bin419]|nr:MAG: CobQ/CobB/MinD/ParA nucleotide binding domain protein [Firmicutes bacterium ADurb.Bin419]
MTRLKLVIADTDEAYVENITGYLMLNYSQRFQVGSFTDKACLIDYLSDEGNKTDVLLISSELYSDVIPQGNVATVILLTSERTNDESSNHYFIDKYQQGDKIAGEIFNIYAQRDDAEAINVKGEKSTKIVAVYSPIGGSGKTTIATSCAIQCAQNGLDIFYLNLEDFQSTALFCDCRRGQNLSNVLYYIRENSKNLQLRIEAAKCIDSEYKLHYLCPPESLLDLQEAKPEELKTLLGEFKSMSQYDIVFVDMSSSFDDKNIAVLDSSDEILLVLPQDAVSDIKIDLFSNEMDILKNRKGIDFSDKINLVLNKYNSYMALEVETVCVCGNSIEYYIPAVPGMMAIKGNNRIMDLQGNFTESIDELIERYR